VNPVLAFDLGKVLVDFDYSIAARRIAARSSKPPENLPKVLGDSPLLVQFETGLIDRHHFYKLISAATGFEGTETEFGAAFADIFSEMQPMVKLHAELRQRGLKSYVFSNTNEIAIEHVRRNFPFFGHFDGYILSYEVRAMKPHVRIYEALEKMAGKRGADIIYIDDRHENIEAGLARGWRAILHETPEKTHAALVKHLPFLSH
jgi:putative hydrolase of the HAD superfamily